MHLKNFFEELFVYNKAVNENIIQVIADGNAVPVRAAQLMIHILLVHQSWNNRMQDKPGLTDFWTDVHRTQMHTINVSLHEVTKGIIAGGETESSIRYTNSKGIEFTNKAQDILFHLVNHSTHHRGQINVLFRTAGIEPVVLDFIFYKR